MDIAILPEEQPVFGESQPLQDQLLLHAMIFALPTLDARDSFSVKQEQARTDAI